MSEVQAPVSVERVVTIYATRGGQMKKITTKAVTWGDLKPLVRAEGFDLNSLLAAESVNKSDLVNELAVLPTEDFRLFLRPKQTKSGAMDRKELFSLIKEAVAKDPSLKAKFTVDGKNVTQLKTPHIEELYIKYIAKASSKKEVVVEKPIKEKVQKKAVIAEKPAPYSNLVSQAISLISSLVTFPSFAKANKHLNNLLIEVDPSKAPAETEEEALRREAKEMGY